MTIAKVSFKVDGAIPVDLSLGYEIIGDEGARPWVITPGGRYGKSYPGIKEMATALAELGNRVVIYDRPNVGESDLCFVGAEESGMQADALAALLRHLELGPTMISGGSGGARVSLLTALRHPDVARALAIWWFTGGVAGMMGLGATYCLAPIAAVWNDGMQGVVDIPEGTTGGFYDQIQANPSNRQRLLDQDPVEFLKLMEKWYLVYQPRDDMVIPGLPNTVLSTLAIPTIVFRSGLTDMHHPRETSEKVHALLPAARYVDPPWPDGAWKDSKLGRRFDTWIQLAPVLNDWANEVL